MSKPILAATLTPDARLEVKQYLGFGPESKAALKAVSSDSVWDGGRSVWAYPYTPGNLRGLTDVAEMLGFELRTDAALAGELQRVNSETEHEHSVRKLIQTFMDDRTLAIAPHTSQPVPPPWRHQDIAWHWAVRVRNLYVALKPGCIAGLMKVQVFVYGEWREQTLRYFEDKHQGPESELMSLMPNGTLKVNDHRDVLYQGMKATIRITFKSGKIIECTPDHELATPDGGWQRADSCVVGSHIMGNEELGSTVLTTETVEKIEDAGVQDVYDIVMADPGRNFVCNGIIVHNCGKTRIGADIIRGKHELGQIRSPEHFPLPERKSAVGKDLPARWAVRGGTLVVCPRVVIGEWMDQLYRWQNIKAVPIVGATAEMKRYRAGLKSWVHICAYDSLESVEDNEYDGIIGDELHYIANEDSNRWVRMTALKKNASWVLGMSGTPISNMLPSLWAQYYWLDGGRTLGPTYESYRRKYFTANGRKLDEKQSAEERISQQISRITMFLTLQQAFPDRDMQKIQQVIRIPMTPEQVNYYELVRKQQSADIIAGRVTLTEMTTRLLKLLQITQGFVLDNDKVVQQFSSAKLKALEEMLTGTGDLTDQRVIVWCRFRHDLKVVSDMLTRKKVVHKVLHGDMTDREKEAMKTAWNNDHTQRVLVGMIQMGIGINLHAPTCVDDKGKPARCSTTVFYGLDWRVTQLEQAMDRVYRGDQVETCLYRYLLSDDLDVADDNGEPLKPIDVRVYESLQDKLNQVTRVNEESVDYIRRLLAS